MYAALTPNLYLGEPPFPAVEYTDPRFAALAVTNGHTVFVSTVGVARDTLRILGLLPGEISRMLTAAQDGLAAAYSAGLPVPPGPPSTARR